MLGSELRASALILQKTSIHCIPAFVYEDKEKPVMQGEVAFTILGTGSCKSTSNGVGSAATRVRMASCS